ncbi:hypothetical protein BS78_07G010800 [Paspalum vaginatum]|nr:hypothetical protein BS78_07G010800 [Paspalum vaginatum]
MVELACYILENAVSLERMELDTIFGHRRCSRNKHTRCLLKGTGILKEAARAVTAIREYIADKVPSTVQLTVREPCSRAMASLG